MGTAIRATCNLYLNHSWTSFLSVFVDLCGIKLELRNSAETQSTTGGSPVLIHDTNLWPPQWPRSQPSSHSTRIGKRKYCMSHLASLSGQKMEQITKKNQAGCQIEKKASFWLLKFCKVAEGKLRHRNAGSATHLLQNGLPKGIGPHVTPKRRTGSAQWLSAVPGESSSFMMLESWCPHIQGLRNDRNPSTSSWVKQCFSKGCSVS